MVTFVHDRLKFGFVHVPKTGGMTVTNFFIDTNKDTDSLKRFSPHNEHFGIHSGVQRIYKYYGEDFFDLYTFAFYRNTYDWLYSLYRYIKRMKHHELHERTINATFEEYVMTVAQDFLRPQKPLVAPRGKNLITRLEPYENFPTVFPEILAELGFSNLKLKSYNVTGKQSAHAYRTHYTPVMVEKVQELYEDDLRFFGFDF